MRKIIVTSLIGHYYCYRIDLQWSKFLPHANEPVAFDLRYIRVHSWLYLLGLLFNFSIIIIIIIIITFYFFYFCLVFITVCVSCVFVPCVRLHIK